MEILTLGDSTGARFLLTDLLRGLRYFVADKGSHYEIEVPTRAGYVRVGVSPGTDVIDVADELICLLDAAKSACFTLHAAVQSSDILMQGRVLSDNRIMMGG